MVWVNEVVAAYVHVGKPPGVGVCTSDLWRCRSQRIIYCTNVPKYRILTAYISSPVDNCHVSGSHRRFGHLISGY